MSRVWRYKGKWMDDGWVKYRRYKWKWMDDGWVKYRRYKGKWMDDGWVEYRRYKGKWILWMSKVCRYKGKWMDDEWVKYRRYKGKWMDDGWVKYKRYKGKWMDEYFTHPSSIHFPFYIHTLLIHSFKVFYLMLGTFPRIFLKWQLPNCTIHQEATSLVRPTRSARPPTWSRHAAGPPNSS